MCKRSDTISTLFYSNFADFVDWGTKREREKERIRRGKENRFLIFFFLFGGKEKKFALKFKITWKVDFDVFFSSIETTTRQIIMIQHKSCDYWLFLKRLRAYNKVIWSFDGEKMDCGVWKMRKSFFVFEYFLRLNYDFMIDFCQKITKC